MENTSADVSEVSSTSSEAPTNSAKYAEVDALAGKDIKAAFAKFSEIEDSEESEETLDQKASESANDESEVVSENSDSQSPKNQLSPGIKARIDGLQGKLKEERDIRKSLETENLKLQEMLKLYDLEVNRYARLAKLDQNVETQREQEIRAEMKRIQEDLPKEVEERYSAESAEMERAEQRAAMKEQILSASEKFKIKAPAELVLFMNANNIRDPMVAAKAFRAEKEKEYGGTQEAYAPRTASSTSTGARNPQKPFQYQGWKTIAQYLDD